MIRSVAAIFAAFVVLNALVMLGTFASAPLARGPAGEVVLTPLYLSVNLTLSAVAALMAGATAAHVADSRRWLHAVLFAVLMLVLAIVMILSPPPQAAAQPKWYTPTVAAIGPLFAVLGGWLRARRDAPGQVLPENSPRARAEFSDRT